MGNTKGMFKKSRDQRGAVLIIVTFAFIMLLCFAALAIDLGHLFLVKNELQNAADAGALAATRELYFADLTVNPNCNQLGESTAEDNDSDKVAVDVALGGGNDLDVQRGHWKFGAGGGFSRYDALDAPDLYQTTEELNNDLTFVNAVQVIAHRSDTPAFSFFARIFGHNSFLMSATAVAYLGYAGTLEPNAVDQPIAICKQSLLGTSTEPQCTSGRMIDSGGGTTNNTGAWTNFTQDPQEGADCATASTPTINPLVCGTGNQEDLFYGYGMGTTNGQVNTSFTGLRNCWMNNASLAPDFRGYPTLKWGLSLPVIDCPSNAPSSCGDPTPLSPLVGSVDLDVLWVSDPNADPDYSEIPIQMEGWQCSLWDGTPDGFNNMSLENRINCWQEFTDVFNLTTWDGTSVGDLTPSEIQKTLFFFPDCTPHEPSGETGGENFGVLAKYPKLVK